MLSHLYYKWEISSIISKTDKKYLLIFERAKGIVSFAHLFLDKGCYSVYPEWVSQLLFSCCDKSITTKAAYRGDHLLWPTVPRGPESIMAGQSQQAAGMIVGARS